MLIYEHKYHCYHLIIYHNLYKKFPLEHEAFLGLAKSFIIAKNSKKVLCGIRLLIEIREKSESCKNENTRERIYYWVP